MFLPSLAIARSHDRPAGANRDALPLSIQDFHEVLIHATDEPAFHLLFISASQCIHPGLP